MRSFFRLSPLPGGGSHFIAVSQFASTVNLYNIVASLSPGTPRLGWRRPDREIEREQQQASTIMHASLATGDFSTQRHTHTRRRHGPSLVGRPPIPLFCQLNPSSGVTRTVAHKVATVKVHARTDLYRWNRWSVAEKRGASPRIRLVFFFFSLPSKQSERDYSPYRIGQKDLC